MKWFKSKKSTLTLASGDLVIDDGTKLDIYDSSGQTLKHRVKSTGQSGACISIRPLRWYEALWMRFKEWRRPSWPINVKGSINVDGPTYTISGNTKSPTSPHITHPPNVLREIERGNWPDVIE